MDVFDREASASPSSARLRSPNPVESPLKPTGQDPDLQSWRWLPADIDLLAEGLFRRFQADGRAELFQGVPAGWAYFVNPTFGRAIAVGDTELPKKISASE